MNCTRTVVAACLAVSGLTAAEAVVAKIDIDLGAAEGPIRRAGSGLMHPFAGPEKPPMDQYKALYDPLRIRMIRTRPQSAVEAHRRDPKVTLMPVLSDAWGYPARGTPQPNAPWKDWQKWDALVTSYIEEFKRLGVHPIYDVWNEPNISTWFGLWGRQAQPGWPDATFEKYGELYLHTYKLIRRLHPEAKITAPSIGMSEPGGWKHLLEFRDFAVASKCVPDYWNWHYGGEHALEQVPEVLRWGLNEGVIYAEFLGPEQSRRAGRAAWEMALVEKAGAFAVGKSSWVRFGADHGSMGDTVFEDSDGKWKKRGMWWVFATLAEMDGVRVRTTASTNKLAALGSVDASRAQLMVLLGNSRFEKTDVYDGSIKSGYRGPVSITIAGAKALGSRVAVTLERIPFDDPKREIAQPEVVVQREMDVIDGQLKLGFDWSNGSDAYRLTLRRAAPRG